jgi:hypothetical protein
MSNFGAFRTLSPPSDSNLVLFGLQTLHRYAYAKHEYHTFPCLLRLGCRYLTRVDFIIKRMLKAIAAKKLTVDFNCQQYPS